MSRFTTPPNTTPTWEPGAFTAARCALWRRLTDEGKARLERWIDLEKTRGCHPVQLPPRENYKAFLIDGVERVG